MVLNRGITISKVLMNSTPPCIFLVMGCFLLCSKAATSFLENLTLTEFFLSDIMA